MRLRNPVPVFGFSEKSPLNRPLLQTVNKSVFVYAKLLGPITKTLCFALKGYIHRSSGITLLFGKRSPSAILKGIWSVHINAINGFPLRPYTHIGKEIIKPNPAFADLNATPTIASIIRGFDVETSVLHHGPCIVGWRGVVIFAATPVSVPSIPVWFHDFIVSYKLFKQVAAGLTRRRAEEAKLFETV